MIEQYLNYSRSMLDQCLANWRHWPLEYCRQDHAQAPTLIETFTVGLNHHTGLIHLGDRTLVLKVFEHSGAHACAAQSWAAKFNLAPKVWAANEHFLLMDYVQSDQLDPIVLATALRNLHSTPVPSELSDDFDLIGFCDSYLVEADPSLAPLHHQLMPALEHFQHDPTPWCVCHNDLVAANCLFNNQTAYFIDWEYAQFHNPWFDLAAVMVYFKFSKSQLEAFFSEYQPDCLQSTSSAIAYSSQIALLWGDILWHSVKFGATYLPELQAKLKKVTDLNARFQQIS